MRKLLIGCGVAAALVVALLIAGGVFVASWFKKQFPEAGQLEKRRTEMVQKFGRPESFVPPLEGVPAAARLGNFVALRESLVIQRDAAAARLGSFVSEVQRGGSRDRGFITKVVDVVGKTEGGASMLSGMLDYMGKRTRLQLAAGMGEGEYDYLYALTTIAFLQWDPVTVGADSSGLGHRDFRKQIAAQKFELQSIFEQQLGNLQPALEKKTSRTADEEAMLAALCDELPAARQKNVSPSRGACRPT